MLKIAVVGTGIIGIKHLAAIAESSSCCLCAVCDINESAASASAAKYGVPYFTDFKDIPAKIDADAVILNLPHWLHCEAAVFFLEHGMHVLVEKPMAITTNECHKMIQTAVQTGKKLAIGHLQRFFPANRKVKEFVQSGELGKLCMVTESRTIDYFDDHRPGWFLNKNQSGGGIVMNYGAHALDKLFYILQSKLKRIHAVTGNIKNDATIEGHAQILAEFESGVCASLTFSGYTNSGYESVYYFTEGALKVVGTHQLYVKNGNDWIPVELLATKSAIADQLEQFCRYIRGDVHEMSTDAYGADIIAAIECIYKE